MTSIGFCREQARKTLKKMRITTPPVKLKPILEFYGLSAQSRHWENERFAGRLLPSKRLIEYNNSHSKTKQRFTVAHELGHFILRHGTSEFNDYDGFESSSEEIEKQANEFAAELLIPQRWLKQSFRDQPDDLTFLAELYWVSRSALTVQLLKCGCIK